MPSVTPAGVTSYKVRTQVCLHHEKKISRRSYEIITWESRRSYVWFCVADSHQSSPRKILNVVTPKRTNVASQSTPYTLREVNIMTAYVHFNQEHNVLICKAHQYAISSKYLGRHFLEEHDLDITVRQDIINYISQFCTTEAPLTYSPDKVVPVPYLSIITGFQCQYEMCNKVLGTLYSVKKHCRLVHHWKAKDGLCWTETQAQTFFQGNDRRYVNYYEI